MSNTINSEIPIVYIHFGNCGYIRDAINVTKITNSDVILLTDNVNNYTDIERVYPIVLDDRINEFRLVYKHLSTNNESFELLCFNRWFILYNFMKKHNISNCMYCDSDCMLVNDISKYINTIKTNAPYISGTSHFKENVAVSPHATYISDITILEEILTFFIDTYKDDFESLVKIRTEEIGPAGGICDMTLFHVYKKLYPDKLKLFSIPVEHEDKKYVFDHNINVPGQYEHSNGIKKLYTKDSELYMKELATDEHHFVCNLHFQGSAKQYIGQVKTLLCNGK